jgi:hypothetical protein
MGSRTGGIKSREGDSIDSKRIVDLLTKMKDQANEKFKEGNYKEAIDGYGKLVKEIEGQLLLEQKSDPRFNSVRDIYVTCLSNCVQSYINIKDYDMAILFGKKVLSIDQDHVKSYFRTGKAMK